MFRHDHDLQFGRMQELEDIRVSDSQNTDPEIKQVICGHDKEYLFHKRAEERARLNELEELKIFGKIITYETNR